MLLKPIGRIRTPYHSLPECPGSAPLADGTSTIEIFANFADGLRAPSRRRTSYYCTGWVKPIGRNCEA